MTDDMLTDVAELFPAQAQAARMKILLARLDAACERALVDPPVYTVKWAPPVQTWTTPEAVAPRVACVCESHWACVTVLRADEFNERRSLATVDDLGRATEGQTEWEVPRWIRKLAAEVEASCPAALHYSGQLATTWLGNDVETVDWLDPQDEKAMQIRTQCEDELAAYSTRDHTEAGWKSVGDGVTNYESFAAQKAWIDKLTAHRRSQLVAAIKALHNDTVPEAAVTWVQNRIESKHGNLLRAYSSCLFQLRAAIERGEIMWPSQDGAAVAA